MYVCQLFGLDQAIRMKPFISRKGSPLMITVCKISFFVTIVIENYLVFADFIVSNRLLARHWKQWK